ncbi:hypothetical protein EDB84DRAFT_660929 [Lactarius hengduanensis]|nr:hypothetical protein EDB84DRAFT_660929 [Lactarius hengduanensis]
MPDHPVQPQQPDNLSFPRPGNHQPHGRVVQNAAIPHPAGDWQQQVHQEGIPLPAENVAMQGHRPPPPYYDVAHHQAQPDYPAVPYMDMRQDGRVIPAHPQAFAPEVQENHDGIFGYALADPAVGPPQYFHGHGALPYQAPLPNIPPADGLRTLAGRFINSPGTRINILRIEPGPAGRFEVWIVLEMADIL